MEIYYGRKGAEMRSCSGLTAKSEKNMKQEHGEADWTLQGLGGPEEFFSHLPEINEKVSKYFKSVCVCVCVYVHACVFYIIIM